MVTGQEIKEAIERVGVVTGDILLFHASLKSFGCVEGGADSVIDGLLDAVGQEGTLVAPTLVQRDFVHAYENWNKDTSPSDVGTITEVLRCRRDAVRSDQATHSCAAIGRLAQELTRDHGTVGPRFHFYGDYAFSYGSPWQMMYELGGKVAFLGVTLRCNTYRHFMECRFIERGMKNISDPEKRASLQKELATHSQYGEYLRQAGEYLKYGTPFTILEMGISGGGMMRMEDGLEKAGILRRTTCGEAEIRLMEIRPMVEYCEKAVRENPEAYMKPQDADWLRRLWAAAE